MKDWRIKYYSDLIVTQYNKRLLENYSTKKFKDILWVNNLFKREKSRFKNLSTVDILKELLKEVKEGKYDKN